MFKKYDAYKDSELPSFGNVPNHWQVIPLCSITTLKSITNVVNEELLSVYLDKGVIRFDDVTEKRTNVTSLDLSKYQLVEEGDFVLNNQQAWRGSVGVSTYRGIVSPAYLVLKLSPKVDAKFANYFFRNSAMVSQYLINSKGVGTIQRNLYWQHLKRSNVVLPPTQEQTQIAEFLDHKTSEIEQAIAIKEQQIALLNERKQIVIQKAVTQGLNPNVAMKDSGVEWIGQIPAHWKVLKFKRACQFIYDGTHGSYPRVEQGYRLLSVRNIINNEFVFREDDSCVSQKHFKEISSKFLIRNDDIQLAIVGGTLGKAAIVKDLEEEIVTQRSLATLRTQPSVLNPNFLLSFIRSPKYQNFLWANAGFSAQPGVYLNTIQNSYLCMPCSKEQTLITEYIENETRKFSYLIGNIKDQIEKLKEYKTTLINDAVTGKIKVA